MNERPAMRAGGSAQRLPLRTPGRPFSSVFTFVADCRSFGERKLLVRWPPRGVREVPGQLAELRAGLFVHQPANGRLGEPPETERPCVGDHLVFGPRIAFTVA